MSFEEGGSRIDDLKLIMGRVSQIASIFDQDGISVRFMNSRESGDGLRSESDAQNLINRIRFTGLTPFGTQLKQKVIEPMILQPARSGQLRKPVLIISVTDGQPAGEDVSVISLSFEHHLMISWTALHLVQHHHWRQSGASSHAIRTRRPEHPDCTSGQRHQGSSIFGRDRHTS